MDLKSQHAMEIQELNNKIDGLQADNTTKQSIKYEAEAMYARCQILEGQLERLVTENAHMREA